ncbi:hypothetical protein [Nocardia jiangsuensis]|uniref:Uncharacterized protein n=1 Tax=Nocardia jiangsuensis TaxID=1691563 RepID=A0ABV8DZ24_9NOCA
MTQPHDSDDGAGDAETREDRIVDGGSEAPGNLAGPGPGDDQDEDPDT